MIEKKIHEVTPAEKVGSSVDIEHEQFTSPERSPQRQHEAASAAPANEHPRTATAAAATIPPGKDPELVTVENILAEGMEDFFVSLNAVQQLEFKQSGENAASRIVALIHRGKYKIRDVVTIIINWLKGLPGINRFYLEQEAKIKADTIIDRYKQ